MKYAILLLSDDGLIQMDTCKTFEEAATALTYFKNNYPTHRFSITEIA